MPRKCRRDSLDVLVPPMPQADQRWKVETGQELLSLLGHTAVPLCVAFSPDGKRLVSAGWNQKVKVWDAETGKELLSLQGHTGFLFSVVFSPDGKRLASASGNPNSPWKPGEVKVWDAEKGKELLSLRGHTGLVRSVVFSPDGKRLAYASDEDGRSGEVKLWDFRHDR
jgi:WD40 repeat protein